MKRLKSSIFCLKWFDTALILGVWPLELGKSCPLLYLALKSSENASFWSSTTLSCPPIQQNDLTCVNLNKRATIGSSTLHLDWIRRATFHICNTFFIFLVPPLSHPHILCRPLWPTTTVSEPFCMQQEQKAIWSLRPKSLVRSVAAIKPIRDGESTFEKKLSYRHYSYF